MNQDGPAARHEPSNVITPSSFAPRMDPRLVVVTSDPMNAELPLGEQRGVITPNELFYLRNRFHFPQLDPVTWTLAVGRENETPVELTFDDLLSMPSRTLLATMECAGNGRTGIHPPAEGETWQWGAVSTAEWTGVPLVDVLHAAGIEGGAREVVAEGADGGEVEERPDRTPFVRSLPLDKALHPDTLLAYAMNGAALPVEHGFPLRLVVPGWYGMASVKWLIRLTATTTAFRGYFQVDRYVMPPGEGESEPRPLTEVGVRSLILRPRPGEVLSPGTHRLQGVAWSGSGSVESVEVSVDGGVNWSSAAWTSPDHRYAWRRWEYLWDTSPGPSVLMSRARDTTGNVQPAESEWNRLGYANNAIRPIDVIVQ